MLIKEGGKKLYMVDLKKTNKRPKIKAENLAKGKRRHLFSSALSDV